MRRYLFFMACSMIVVTQTNSLHAYNDDLERFSRKLERWWYSPNNNDMRVVGLTIAGITSTIVGLSLVKKGIEQTLSARPHHVEHASNTTLVWHGIKNIGSRISGCGMACLGVCIMGSGITLIVFNKETLFGRNKIFCLPKIS